MSCSAVNKQQVLHIEKFKCPVCQKKLNLFKKLNNFCLYKCHYCSHLISNININKNYYKNTYNSNYIENKHRNWMNNPNQELFQSIFNFIKYRIKKKGKIIELGSGKGSLLTFLSKYMPNINFTGVDLYKNFSTSSNLKFYDKDFLTFHSKIKYQFIISIAVIEHMGNLEKFFNKLNSLIKKMDMSSY